MHKTFHNEKYFTEPDAKYLIKCIIQHMANKSKNKKLFIDVHENLGEYNKYYKDEGFILTEHHSQFSPHWIECVKDL